ncbi:rhomboid family protein [Terrimonas pollutisoli]|uniref:rhomboid family protein n=1 Tax=Terrimonas pollutisoli TaxID=3034147 RepID=UPI0023EB35D1|nr:rhomboid family intramembrane serine protease [Terrimonas sp. H1YJ31]
MAYHERQHRKRLSLAQANNALILLIAINMIIFVVLAFLYAVFHLRYENAAEARHFYETKILSQFALPADFSKIAAKPWTILTHMFTHDSVWHLLGNMLWLWVFGYIFLDLTGNRKIIPLYIYGALGGALAFILAYNFLPGLKQSLPVVQALGASAGVMAIAAGVTTISPGYRIFPMLFGGIPIWVLMVIYLIIDLAGIPLSNPGGHIAHLMGALTGFLFIVSFRRGYDWSEWMNNFFDWFGNLFNPDKPKKGKNIKQELFYKSDKQPYKKTPNITEQRVNEILDKINLKGYNTLTEEEKDILRRASQE